MADQKTQPQLVAASVCTVQGRAAHARLLQLANGQMAVWHQGRLLSAGLSGSFLVHTSHQFVVRTIIVPCLLQITVVELLIFCFAPSSIWIWIFSILAFSKQSYFRNRPLQRMNFFTASGLLVSNSMSQTLDGNDIGANRGPICKKFCYIFTIFGKIF